MKKDVKKKVVAELTLAEQVAEVIGEAGMNRLAAQPLALARGGIASLVQAACAEAAGWPDPLRAAVALLRVKCGSAASAANLKPTT